MPRNRRRNEWTRTKHGGWTRSFGEPGMRVRLFQNRRGGTFYRAVWVPGRGRDVASLGTEDRDEAERHGRALLAALLEGTPMVEQSVVTLEALWDRYRREAPTFAACTKTTRQDAAGRADVLLGFFGTEFEVATLTEHDVRRYEAARRPGGIAGRSGRKTRLVRARTVDADLVLLNTMLRWATTVREPNGERWLKENPLAGIRRPREPNPQRPIATWERFVKTREAMRALAEDATTEGERERWIEMELALVLAEGTGRRLSAIRQLRWDDIDLEHGSIRWRAEADKKRRENVVPMPSRLGGQILRFPMQVGTSTGWIFARESDGAEPMDRHLFDKWLAVAERRAKLPKLQGGLWHPYRRKWATERKHLPLKDVAAAGGWQDVETLLECYQQPDHDTLQTVTDGAKTLHDPGLPPEKRQQKRQPHAG